MKQSIVLQGKLGATGKLTGKSELRVLINIMASNAFRDFIPNEEEDNEERDRKEDEQEEEWKRSQRKWNRRRKGSVLEVGRD
jgi:hypothetical protein